MKRIILLLFLVVNLFAYDLKKVDFATFCNYVSYTLGENIIISKDVPTSFSVFMPFDRISNSELKKDFFLILRSYGLKYRISSNTILIYKNDFNSSAPLSTHLIKFAFISKNSLSKYLKTLYPNLKFVIFKDRLVLISTRKTFLNIKHLVSDLMSSYLQARINFLILVIDNKKAKQIGSKLTLKNPFKRLLFDIVSNSVTFNNSLPSGVQFSTFLQILNSKGISQTISKPTILLISGSNYTLESVHNIPYIQKTVTINKDGNPVTQSQIKYKDIGLKIYIKNVFITKKNIDFDMDIYVQNLISLDNNIPITDTKHFNTHIQLTRNHSSYLLAGLRSVTKISSKEDVPVLSKIPFLGLLFRNDKSNIEDLSFAFYISTNFFKDMK